MTDRPSRQSERLPAVLLDPALLDEGDYWTWTCGVCATVIQGGRPVALDSCSATAHDGCMKQTIAHDATEALRAANLTCRYGAIQALGATRFSVETTRYADAEWVLAEAGLVLVDADPDDFVTHARIVRAKVSKR